VIETRPDNVIINGDVAKAHREAADYQAVKQLLAPVAEQTPIYMVWATTMIATIFPRCSTTFPGHARKFPASMCLVVERPPLRFILLDSLLYTNKAAGLLGKAQREWFDQFLRKSDERTTIIFVHHTLGDGDGDLLDVEHLFRLVRPIKKVKAIFYGPYRTNMAFSQEDGYT